MTLIEFTVVQIVTYMAQAYAAWPTDPEVYCYKHN